MAETTESGENITREDELRHRCMVCAVAGAALGIFVTLFVTHAFGNSLPDEFSSRKRGHKLKIVTKPPEIQEIPGSKYIKTIRIIPDAPQPRPKPWREWCERVNNKDC